MSVQFVDEFTAMIILLKGLFANFEYTGCPINYGSFYFLITRPFFKISLLSKKHMKGKYRRFYGLLIKVYFFSTNVQNDPRFHRSKIELFS